MVRVFAVFTSLATILATAQDIPLADAGRPALRSKPWGELVISEFPLPLSEGLTRLLDIPSAQTEWVFEEPSVEELQTALEQEGFTEEEISNLVGNSTVIHYPVAGTRLFPNDDLVRDMPLVLRQKLHRVLSRNPRNRFHHRPLFMNTANVTDWFRESGIPRFVQADVASIAYPTPRKRGFFISDVSFLMRQAETSPDEQLLLRGLMRQRALMVRLKFDADSDLQALSGYWSAGFNNKDILPIMESVVRAENVDHLDVAHLLPPTPRRNLLTYPDLEEGTLGRYPDWFWTCYNFFRFSPVEIYADSENREAIIAREFSLALPPFEFGDMLVIRNGEKAIHGCIYIADNIVYTKNSADIFSPWLFMKIENVLAYHDMTGNAEITIHRKRQVPLP